MKWHKYAAPPVSFWQCQLYNALCRRRWPVQAALGQHSVQMTLLPPRPFLPRCACGLRMGPHGCVVALDSVDVLYTHESLARVARDFPLPESVLQAVLEVLLLPALRELSEFLGLPCHTEDVPADVLGDVLGDMSGGWADTRSPTDMDSAQHGAGEVHFDLRVTQAGEDICRAGLRLTFLDEEGMQTLVGVLNAVALSVQNAVALSVQTADASLMPNTAAPRSQLPPIPVLMTVETGSLPLPPATLASLRAGDVVLTQDYAPRQGTVYVRVGQWRGVCAVQGREAVLVSWLGEEQDREEGMSATEMEGAGLAFTPEQLEVEVVFELERRRVSLAELSTLRPGYTFALGKDALAPVTLRVQGAALGEGRLVEMDGVLGVQITRLYGAAQEAREDV